MHLEFTWKKKLMMVVYKWGDKMASVKIYYATTYGTFIYLNYIIYLTLAQRCQKYSKISLLYLFHCECMQKQDFKLQKILRDDWVSKLNSRLSFRHTYMAFHRSLVDRELGFSYLGDMGAWIFFTTPLGATLPRIQIPQTAISTCIFHL